MAMALREARERSADSSLPTPQDGYSPSLAPSEDIRSEFSMLSDHDDVAMLQAAALSPSHAMPKLSTSEADPLSNEAVCISTVVRVRVFLHCLKLRLPQCLTAFQLSNAAGQKLFCVLSKLWRSRSKSCLNFLLKMMYLFRTFLHGLRSYGLDGNSKHALVQVLWSS